ncbi:MAG: DUF4388 domain-containing protein [Chloroflexia bacterium]
MDTTEKDDFDLQGRIGCFSLSDLLQTLSFTQKTGTLTLIQGWNTRTICYEQGRITYIAAATRLPTPVEMLLQSGQLTQKKLVQTLGPNWKKTLGVQDPEHIEPDSEPGTSSLNGSGATSSHAITTAGAGNGSTHTNGNGHDSAMTAGVSKSRRVLNSGLLADMSINTRTDPYMGNIDNVDSFVPPDYSVPSTSSTAPNQAQVLLKYKLASPEDLQWCEEQMLETTIYTLFLWRNCRFTFQGDLLVKADGIPVSVNAEKLIIEGTRRVDEWIRISPVIPSVLMAFRRLPRPVTGPLSDEAREVLAMVDGVSDVSTIARKRQRTQFDTAKLLHGLTKLGLIQTVAPDKYTVMELFKYTVEAIYIKLVMYGYSRKAMEFEYELNRFARENKLKVRMHIGKIRLTDQDLNIDPTALLDFYKLFIAIESNKFAKLFPPEIRKGLTEALYQHMDPKMRALMQMYEFHAMEGLLNLPPATEVEA